MAKCNPLTKFISVWPGIVVALFCIGLATTAFITLLIFSLPDININEWTANSFTDPYLWRVIRFTFWQASLSVFFSIVPAIFLALALYRHNFPGKNLLLRLCNMTLILPVLIAIFGLLTIYGQQGWVAHLCSLLGIPYRFSIYGLHGILIAHVFFNLPLACRLFLQILDDIPAEQQKIAAQLGFTNWQRFKFIEWPTLQRQVLPTAALVFMLCFASFTVVLSLGGGPANTTIELAIYEALRYDFDLQRAALLGLLQLSFCIIVLSISQHFSHWLPVGQNSGQRWLPPLSGFWLHFIDYLIIIMALLLLLPPLMAVIINGLNLSLFTVLADRLLWQSIITSLFIAISTGVLTVILAFLLLWSCRQIHFNGYIRLSNLLSSSSLLILAMPAIVLATGCFLLFINTIGLPESPFLFLIIINSLMALPYSMKLLAPPMYNIYERYNLLILSLAIPLFSRIKLIEFKILQQPIAQALAFACILSIGDLSVIALFGNNNFFTLPYYLYGQLNAYRSNNAAVAAFILLILCLLIFTTIEKIFAQHDKTQ